MSALSLAPGPLATIFISYSTEDTELAKRMLRHIERDGIQCFFAPRDIEPQVYWATALEEQIRRANLLLLLYTDSAGESPYVRREVEAALRLKTEIWAVMDPNAEIGPFFENLEFLRRQSFYLHAGGESKSFDRVLAEIDRLYSITGTRFHGQITIQNCPYPGSKPFSTAFEDVFFGRREAIVDLMSAIDAGEEIVLVYGPSGAGKSSLLTVGLPSELGSGWLYPPPIRANTAYGMLREVLPAVTAGTATASVPDDALVAAILDGMKAGKPNRYLFCFDQMEEFFAANPNPGEIRLFLDCLRHILEKRPKLVKFLVSFRKEFLADIRRRIGEYDFYSAKTIERAIWKLSTEDAMPCIAEPARQRGVSFNGDLAHAILAALVKGQVGEPIVNPMDIQKVCKVLWDEIARLDGAPHSQMDGGKLARILKAWGKETRGVQTDAATFVDKVLADFLHNTITEVAGKLNEMGVPAPNPREYVTLSLMDFVGSGNVRQRVSETDGWVAQLPLGIVKELINAGLVQSCGDRVYELAHDALAREIAEYGETSDAVFARKSLDAVLKREAREKRVFNRHADLLVKLEEVRNNCRPFDPGEADFLLRCALGDQRRKIKGPPVSLEAWTRMLGDKSPERLVEVLKDGLSDDSDESVQLDVMDQLVTPYVSGVVDGHLEELGAQLQKLALNGSPPVRAGACAALVALRDKRGIAELFEAYRNSRLRSDARIALALVRDAVDTIKGPPETFRAFWKSFGQWNRLSVLMTLLWWRITQSYGRILYMIAVTAPITAVGAIIPFVIVGPMGASLTLEAKNLGFADGIFHGATGGLVWGLGVTAGLLAYSVVWRGGRLRHGARDAAAMSIFGMLGAAIGGAGNAAVITFVFAPDGLVNAGWLEPGATGGSLREVLWITRHGWIMPIFGAALGLGIGWSIAHILADPLERWRGNPEHIANPHPLSRANLPATLRGIAGSVLKQSWRNIIWLALGSLLIYAILRPGAGVCDPAVHPEGVLPAGCKEIGLAPLWARTAGLAVVILGGSMFQEIGFLASLLSVQFGVHLRKQRSFLMSAEAMAKD